MLGLAEEIHCDPVRIGLAVANDENFRRTGDHIDAHAAEYLSLGGRHIGVAGAHDLVDRFDRFGAVG